MIENILFPIFFVIIIGYLLRRKGIINNVFNKCATQLIYHILLPVFFFWIIASGKATDNFDWRVYLASIFSILIVFVIAQILIPVSKISYDYSKFSFAFANSCYHINLCLGLSLISYLFDKDVIRAFCIFLLFLIPFTDIFSFIGSMSTLKRIKKNDFQIRHSLRHIFMNPILIAGGMGLLSSGLNFSIPVFLNKTFEMTSSIILPLSLIIAGGYLAQIQIKSCSKLILVNIGLKTILMPILVYIFLQLFSLDTKLYFTIVLFFAFPLIVERRIAITRDNCQSCTDQFITISTIASLISFSCWFLILF